MPTATGVIDSDELMGAPAMAVEPLASPLAEVPAAGVTESPQASVIPHEEEEGANDGTALP